jgi:SAM-dependent methyltransferase
MSYLESLAAIEAKPMQFSQKVRKLETGQAFESAARHLRRAAFPRRFGLSLDPERLIKSIDREGFEAIRQRYASDNPGEAWPKYLNLPLWMTKNLRRVRELRLDWGARQRILDLGCGAGYFLYICRWLGHDALGLDIETVPMYGEMIALLGLTRVICRVQSFRHLPRLGKKFDLITAFMICFNGHKGPDLWTRDQWSFFLDDIATQLAPGGRVCLGFNQEEDGRFYSEDLHRFFAGRGAEFSRNLVVLSPHERGLNEIPRDGALPSDNVLTCQ